jgi:hypothetical protein
MTHEREEELPAGSVSTLRFTNLQPFHEPRFWDRWCKECAAITKHRATAQCDQGTLAHCSRCSRRIILQGAQP